MIATFKTSDFVANLKAALLAVQTDEARMHQCQVRIELAAGVARFVATNGHWLLVSEAPYLEVVGVDECGKKVLGSSEEALCIHRADVVAILKALKSSKKAADWDVELDTRGTVSQMGRTATFAPSRVDFVPYRSFIPAVVVRRDEASMPAIDPAYLEVVGQAFGILTGGRPCGVRVQPTGGELDPIVVTSTTDNALALVMPMRTGRPRHVELLTRFRNAPAPRAA